MNRALRIVPLAVLLVGCDTIGFGTLGPPLPIPPRPPAIDAPRYAAFMRGREDTLAFYAWDEDGDAFSISASCSALPRNEGAKVTMNPIVGDPGSYRCFLRWTAAPTDTGIYRVSFRGVNRLVGDPDTTFIYTVDHDVDLPPRVSCPELMGLNVGDVRTFSVIFDDPDGDPILELTSPMVFTSSWKNERPKVLSWTSVRTGNRITGTISLLAEKLPAEYPADYYVVFNAVNALHGGGRTRLVVSGP